MSQDIISRLRANDPTLTIVGIRSGSGIEREICSSVQENSRIKTLGISDFYICAHAANDLSTALSKMPFLEEVYMTNCSGESIEVFTTLASSLAGRHTLQRLDLFDCNIDDGCAQVISTSFSTHQSLREIFLEGNQIGNFGAISIGSMLALNESLKVVTLRESNIGSDGFEAIARGIAQSRSLEGLNLSDDAADFESIQDAFKRAIYNDDSIEAVLTGSNHTLYSMSPRGDVDLCLLLEMNSNRPEEARRKKLIRFLDENPGSVCVHDTLLPSAIEKIGRVGGVSALHELVRAMPDIFE